MVSPEFGVPGIWSAELCEALAHSKALIMVPGILPSDPTQATRRRTSPDWTGDIWKLPEILQTHRPE
ncbi:MAG: hypothetical protein LC657_18170, partial [Desulfobacteraceae bacterium]|nr:hypothetical protein [Desulfobacteraceae bacterium]